MNNNIWNDGAIGVEQYMYLGDVNYNVADGAITLPGVISEGILVKEFMCRVQTAFNAGTTNVLTLGTAADDDAYMGADDITEGTPGFYSKATAILAGEGGLSVVAKYAQTGTAATTGKASFWAKIVRLW